MSTLAPERASGFDRLNLGSGRYPLNGWKNVDAFTDADIRGDVRDLVFHNIAEVRMSHLLEHIPWRDTVMVLERVRSWVRPGGLLTVEVPDMAAILALGTTHPLWHKYVYGDQSHRGEYHLAGFTARTLLAALEQAGWRNNVSIRAFRSIHQGREGMPCLEAVART